MKEVNNNSNPARFQRTDQWRPVYSWLESLDLDEVIKSKDISDWLASNPDTSQHLGSRHSRYHLMHYIKKCHLKILKKRNGGHLKPMPTPLRVKPLNVSQLPLPLPLPISANTLTNVPKERDLFQVKQQEALRKYEILVELEKQLSTLISEKHAREASSG